MVHLFRGRKHDGDRKLQFLDRQTMGAKIISMLPLNSHKVEDFQPKKFCIFDRIFSDMLHFRGRAAPSPACYDPIHPLHLRVFIKTTTWRHTRRCSRVLCTAGVLQHGRYMAGL